MADQPDWLSDVKRYDPEADEAAVKGIVKHLGIALHKPDGDAALVSCSDRSELDRVRESWLKKKLARTESDADLDKAIDAVCGTMKEDHRKKRVTFYYLLAKNLKVLDSLH